MNDLDLVRIAELLALARARGASDLHLGIGERPMLRIDGQLVGHDVPPPSADALRAFCAKVLAARGERRLTVTGAADAACREGTGAPYRLHAYRTAAGLRAAIRLHPVGVLTLERLGLPAIVTSFVARPHGLVLLTGPSGSGKTTALAALVDHLNRTAERVVLTVEDPVEYVHAPQRSLIVHCEVDADVLDYAEAVRGFLRADPDVILVGEMRDQATIAAVLTAAETGHLVLSSLHTNDAAQTVDRMLDAFPSTAQAQVRGQLAATLVAIASLRLIPSQHGHGRVCACEILIATDAVRAMIRDGKTHQLHNALLTGRNVGMQPLEAHLSDLVVRGRITLAAARAAANRPADVRELERAG